MWRQRPKMAAPRFVLKPGACMCGRSRLRCPSCPRPRGGRLGANRVLCVRWMPPGRPGKWMRWQEILPKEEFHQLVAAVQRLLQPSERLVVREFGPAGCTRDYNGKVAPQPLRSRRPALFSCPGTGGLERPPPCRLLRCCTPRGVGGGGPKLSNSRKFARLPAIVELC